MNHHTDPPSAHPRHPIAIVAERTGLSRDLLRVWERRYAAVRPTRSDSGQRLYSDADIARLKLLASASNAGRNIGQIAGLPTSALARLVEEDLAQSAAREPVTDAPLPDRTDTVIPRALDYVRALDARGLEDLLRGSAAVLGVPVFLDRVASPILREVGERWHGGRLSIAEEHFASATVGDVVTELMRSIARNNGAPRVLVATLAGDRHIIGAALAGAAAAAEGWNVIYLGADLPAREIAAAAVSGDARAVAVSVAYADDPQRVTDELRTLRDALPGSVTLVVGGRAIVPRARELVEAGIDVGDSLHDLRATLRRLRS